MTSDEFGQDLEHVEVLQKKFDEFQKVRTLSKLYQRGIIFSLQNILAVIIYEEAKLLIKF